MAERRRQAKNQSMFIRPQPRQTWLWLAPYVAIGVFALAMLIVTGLLQWREQDTALSALEGDMHWAERTIEARLHAHQDFLTELGREQEFRQLTYESFQVRASRYVRHRPGPLRRRCVRQQFGESSDLSVGLLDLRSERITTPASNEPNTNPRSSRHRTR